MAYFSGGDPRLLKILAGAGLAYGLLQAWSLASFQMGARETTGEIIGGSKGVTVIRFEVDRRTYQFQENVGTTLHFDPHNYRGLGRKVPVLYRPTSPSEARWKNRMWLWPGVILSFSSLCLIAGLFPAVAESAVQGGRVLKVIVSLALLAAAIVLDRGSFR